VEGGNRGPLRALAFGVNSSPGKKPGASAPRPTVRHNRARAELGECYCPKCAPELHVQPATEPAPPPPAGDTAQESTTQPLAMPRVERIAIGGDPRLDQWTDRAAWEAEIERCTQALRAAEARWLTAYAGLDPAITAARAADRDVLARQNDLRDVMEKRYRVRMEVADVPRPWIDPARWRAVVEAQRCALALVSQMAAAGPDWTNSVAAERTALVGALAALDALSPASGAASSPDVTPLTSGVSAARGTDGED